MKLELNFQDIKKVIDLAGRIPGKHMTLPVLSCFLFDIGKNTLTAKATNLDIGIEVTVPVKCDSPQTLAVPSAIISAFVSQIGEYSGTVKMELSSGNLQVFAAKSKCVIKTVPHEDFPDIPEVPAGEGEKVSILPETLSSGLKSVWYSASVSSVKPELSSVYIRTLEGKMVFSATDSFRLAEKRVNLPAGTNIPDTLVPFKNISEIIRVLDSIKGNVDVIVGKNLISFDKAGEIRLISRIVDGIFPDYKQIIPKSYQTEVVVLKQDLLNALKISNIFSDKFNQVHFSVDPKQKLFEVHTKNNDIGENKTAIDAAIEGEKIDINFNYKYVVDCFQSIDSDSISLHLSGTNKPMVVRPVSGEQSFMYLVMPMNR